jgi:RimJ/RimL family protein N-acetyltransferase
MDGIPIPILRSRRLTLRRLRVDDHPRLFAMANDVEVTRYLNEGSPPSAEEVWQRMAAAIGQWGLRGYGMMAVEDQDGFVGRLGFYHPYDQPDPLLVYVLCRDGWGKGYATEAVTLIRDWIFVVHKLRRFLSHIVPDNVASARVASKLGAIRNGTTVQRGTVLDVWRYDAPD